MNDQEQDRMKKLLHQALPPVAADTEQKRDLWPAMLLRMNAKPATLPQSFSLWFDWALLAGIAGVIAVFPSSIALLLYYL